jgi:hypothetical protein
MPASFTHLSTVRQNHASESSWISKTGGFWSVLALVTLWKFLAASKLGLIFDECYYWEWSLHPQASYYDHPPMTAWLIMAGHALFGQTPLAVRFGAILSGILLALAGRLLGRDLFGKEAGNRAGIFLLLAPIFAGNSFLMTPDTFLMPAWAFAVYFAWRGSRGNMLWWLAAGLAAGLGMLSKYTMVLYFGGLALFWLTSQGKRGRLFLGISSAALVSLLCFTPVIWWNSQHEWISFANQMRHGFQNEHQSLINFQNLTDYAAFLIVLVSPLLGLFCFRSAATRLLDERFRFLALFFWTVVLFFAFSAAKAHIEANWPMAAFVTGLILVAADWERYGKAWRHAAILVLLLADFGAVLGVGYLTLPKDSPLAIANLSFNTDFLKRCLAPLPHSDQYADKLTVAAQQGFGDFQGRLEEFLGPQAVAQAVAEEFKKSGADFLCVSSYQFAGVIAFYAPELESVMWLPYLGRYRLVWVNDRAWAGKTALAAEWPHTGPDYSVLFTEFSPPRPLNIPGIKHPVYLCIGKNYLPEKVNYRPGH